MSREEIKYVKDLKYKLCFVSPELHKPRLKKQIKFTRELKKNIEFFDSMDSICTKDYNLYLNN